MLWIFLFFGSVVVAVAGDSFCARSHLPHLLCISRSPITLLTASQPIRFSSLVAFFVRCSLLLFSSVLIYYLKDFEHITLWHIEILCFLYKGMSLIHRLHIVAAGMCVRLARSRIENLRIMWLHTRSNMWMSCTQFHVFYFLFSLSLHLFICFFFFSY